MSRDIDQQLQTQQWLLGLFNARISEAEESGELGARLDKLREGRAATEDRIAKLERGESL